MTRSTRIKTGGEHCRRGQPCVYVGSSTSGLVALVPFEQNERRGTGVLGQRCRDRGSFSLSASGFRRLRAAGSHDQYNGAIRREEVLVAYGVLYCTMN